MSKAHLRSRGLVPAKEQGRYIPTPDNWYPNYQDNTVRGRVLPLSDGALRICFWGADDYGLELDVPEGWDAGTQRHWERWLDNLAIIDQETLRKMGFKPA